MNNTKTYIGISIVCAMVMVLGYYSYNSPVATLENIKKAAQQNDKDRLRDLIDFDLVKAGLKEDIKAQLVTSVGQSDKPFAVLGIALATMMVDSLVDTIVSPAGLTRFIDKGRIDSPQRKPGDAPSDTSIEEKSTHDGVNIERGYDEFSRYRVRIRRSGTNPAQPLVLTLRREGWFSWKLTGISIPSDLLTGMANDLKGASPQQPVGPLALEAHDLQADPAHKGLLILSATIRNRATTALAYPYLELTLTDSNDRVVVRRALAPPEYFGEKAEVAKGIPANGEVRVKLFVDASATTQAGYRLYLFYPTQESARIAQQIDPQKLRILLPSTISGGK
jgi:hypothetical protein